MEAVQDDTTSVILYDERDREQLNLNREKCKFSQNTRKTATRNFGNVTTSFLEPITLNAAESEATEVARMYDFFWQPEFLRHEA